MDNDVRQKKNLEIQALRGIAILFALFHHVPGLLLPSPPKFFFDLYAHFTFWGGVDLFFVISGFVITKSYFKLQVNHRPGETALIFLRKRALRILPPAWFWLFLHLILTAYWNASGVFGNFQLIFNYAKSAILQYANIYGLNCGEGIGQVSCGPNQIYWSLSLEEQFYLVIPIWFFVFRKNIAWVLLPIAFVQAIWPRPEWSIGWAVRSDALIWGVLIAHFSENKIFRKMNLNSFRVNKLFRIAFLVLGMTAMAFLPAKGNGIPLGTGMLGLVCAALVLVAAQDNQSLWSDGPIRRFFVFIGERSYSLYLCHVVAYCSAIEIFYQITPIGYRISESDSLKLVFIALPLTFLAAEASYRLLEQRTYWK